MSAKITKIEAYNTVEDFNRLPETAKTDSKIYEELVESLIREKYSVSAELAILRQQNSKYSEFMEYNEYAEKCKARAKQILGR